MSRLNKLLQPCIFILILLIMGACSKESEDMTSQLDASAGTDNNVLVGQLVTLNGSGSSDSQGNEFDFSWEFISKPSSSNSQLENNDMATPTFTPDVQGKYKIKLTISNATESRDTVNVYAYEVVTVEGNYENMIPGTNVGVRDFVVACGELFATCEFTEIGGIEALKIAKYNGSSWTTVGCGLENGSVYDMIVFQDDLYVTGSFDEIGCISASNIARWDCSGWSEVEGGLTGGEDPAGFALEIFNDELYVAGRFTQAGNVSAGSIAKWDGVEWSAVGDIEGGSVRELEVYKQKLYAGGYFETVNSINTGHIAAYDGISWTALGSTDNLELGSTGVVWRMAVLKDLLYFSGDFTIQDFDVSELITWNGSQFNDFGRPISLYAGNVIDELAVINDILYIGGEFRNVVGSQAGNLLQWDGEKWGIMSAGVSGFVLSIEQYNNQIYIGGEFDVAGGQASENISIWSPN